MLVAFLILLFISGTGAAAEIIVQPGSSIQKAVNSSTSGDIITIKPGTYIENINVTKGNLTIRSESGNPDNTIIKAKSSGANVFLLQGSNIKITGLKIMGATRSGYSGICLSSCSNCIIENNKILSNCYGIYVLRSKGDTLSKNTATNNKDYGIVLGTATSNTLSGNKAINNGRGIHVGSSDGNTFSGNTIQGSSVYGLYVCPRSDSNQIYNNYFNDTNMTIRNGIGNYYYTTKTSGTNIVGGPYIGGNFWGKPDGTGFSNTAVDNNRDGISDSAYKNITSSIYSDNLPLVNKSEKIKPIAAFSAFPTSGNAPLNVTFTDKSTGTPTAWKWTFGDGTNSTIKNPKHKYSKAGNYTVALTVSNAAGSNTTTKTNYIKVTATTIKPVASFTSNVTSGKVPVNVAFTDKSTGTPTAWKWTFGDGTTSTAKNPTHKYSKAGNYTVALTVSNAAGSNTITKTNYIKVSGTSSQTPVAAFSASPTSGNTPLNVTFTDSSTGSPTTWSWNFGDGTSATVKNPVHTYSTAGSYSVTLKVGNSAGNNTTTKSSYIKVTAKNTTNATIPVVSFWGSRTSGTAPLTITFTDASTNTPTSWYWSFGDGTYSTVQRPRHTYSKAGTYSVTLKASNAAGTGTKTRANYIKIT
ncbi:right-handed parallel beta-helix repeat-containing protein [Methanosarcina sp. UBA289]|uniref:right-handed parallel beta-helix repeat-containing protein n=1 Tax=Methanosarcina sp. UBA289 TaxID=1915574 RepID=UPI0025D31602|nr:PKD domain-containing protein [Methanosarcina sp. UBA289]